MPCNPRRTQPSSSSDSGARGAAAELKVRIISDLADADAPDNRPLLEILPGELVGALGLELIAQRKRIVIVDQHEKRSRLDALECLEDRRVLLAGWNDTNIELACGV